MFDRLKKTILKVAQDNVRGYILIATVFFAGLILSFALNISSGSEEEIRLYFEDFLFNVKNYSTDSVKTFGIAMNSYFRIICILFLLSLTVGGSIGIFAYIFVKGFSCGAVFVALFKTVGVKSILFFICSILPHALILVPCLGTYISFCAKNSYRITKGVKDLKSVILSPFIAGVICILLCSGAALVQSYVEPVLIRLISI